MVDTGINIEIFALKNPSYPEILMLSEIKMLGIAALLLFLCCIHDVKEYFFLFIFFLNLELKIDTKKTKKALHYDGLKTNPCLYE